MTHKKNIYVDTSGYLAEQLPELFSKSDSRAPPGQGAFRHRFPLCRSGESTRQLRQARAERCGKRKNPAFERARAVRTLGEKTMKLDGN